MIAELHMTKGQEIEKKLSVLWQESKWGPRDKSLGAWLWIFDIHLIFQISVHPDSSSNWVSYGGLSGSVSDFTMYLLQHLVLAQFYSWYKPEYVLMQMLVIGNTDPYFFPHHNSIHLHA